LLDGPYCVPNTEKTLDIINDALSSGKVGAAWADIQDGAKTIAICSVTALILSVIFMWMMSACARGLAMFSLVLLFISFFGGAGACLYMSTKSPEQTIFLISGCILGVCGLIFVCCVYCNRNSLETAIAIVDASADFFIATKRIVFVSLGYFMISMLFVLLWIAGQVCVMSLNTFEKGTKGP